MQRDNTIGPNINPSGPKNKTPPRIEKRTKIDGAFNPFPKKYAESMLSMSKLTSTPSSASPIAATTLPVNAI